MNNLVSTSVPIHFAPTHYLQVNIFILLKKPAQCFFIQIKSNMIIYPFSLFLHKNVAHYICSITTFPPFSLIYPEILL